MRLYVFKEFILKKYTYTIANFLHYNEQPQEATNICTCTN